MTSNIERVVRQARTTFSRDPRPSSTADIRDDLAELKRAADALDVQSVGLDPRLLRRDVRELTVTERPHLLATIGAWCRSLFHRRTPVTYIRVYEDRDTSVGVFVLRDGAKIPLHDHPGMYGVLKVVHGEIEIQSYTVRECDGGEPTVGRHVDAVKLAPVVVGVNDEPCVLYPEEANVHQVASSGGPAVFVDVLGPPYNTYDPLIGEIRCRYFEEVKKSEGTKLTIVSEPNNYRCDVAPYTGPRFGSFLEYTWNF